MLKTIFIVISVVIVVGLAVACAVVFPYKTAQQSPAAVVQPSGTATTACDTLTSDMVNTVIGNATNEASDEGQPTDEIMQSQCVYVQNTRQTDSAASLQLMITTAITGTGRQQLRDELKPLADFIEKGRPEGGKVVHIERLGDQAFWDEKYQQIVVLTKDSQYKVALRLMQPEPTTDYSKLESVARQTVANLKP